MTEGDEDKLTQQLGETSLNENSSKEEKKTSSLMSKWNLSAPSFVPNPNAAAFVPSFAMGGSGAAGNPFAMVGESQAPAAAPVKEKPAKSNAAPAQTKASAPKKQPTPAKAETQEEPAELTAEEKKATQEFYAEEEEDDIPEDPNQKEHMNIVFIGHVDAGKSTMGGHLLYLTGMVDKRTLDKYEREAREQNRESWYLSWALDTNDDERAKGKTVEVGRAHFETDTKKYTILDAPGHKSYVPHMISGANQADVAVLVISARKGEFETGFEKGGQTREHVELVKTFGVQRLIVVINKMDDSTVGWSKERYDEIVGKLTPFVRSRGFKIGSDTVFMPVSGFTGANLKDKMTSDMCPWYDGPSLLQYLDNISGIDRQVKAPFLMPILDHFKDAGVIVTGKIEAGRIAKGKHLVMMPTKVFLF
jgi:peptide chain release factor subunit 3